MSGLVAVVTGGGSGIGRATALALAEQGASVVVVDRPGSGTVTVREVEARGGDGLALALDVRQPEDMTAMAQRTLDAYGRIDVLVASAGLLRTGPPTTVERLPLQEWDTVLETNLRGVFLSNRAVLPTMLAQHSGTIINLSSTSGRKGLAYDAAYCASKFGVIGFSEALAEEVGSRGVKVQVVLPGPVDTPVWSQNGPLPPPSTMLAPERVADVVLRLLTLPGDMVVTPLEVVPAHRRAGRPEARPRPELVARGALGAER
jgi:NAD(P)-dependent dehydrogenase (short-subunit alcohol dehydrogenase family)